jgi:hypothetical protein
MEILNIMIAEIPNGLKTGYREMEPKLYKSRDMHEGDNPWF